MHIAVYSVDGRYNRLDDIFPLFILSSFSEYVFGTAALWIPESEGTMIRGHDDMRI